MFQLQLKGTGIIFKSLSLSLARPWNVNKDQNKHIRKKSGKKFGAGNDALRPVPVRCRCRGFGFDSSIGDRICTQCSDIRLSSVSTWKDLGKSTNKAWFNIREVCVKCWSECLWTGSHNSQIWVWWMPKLVSKGFGPARWKGSLRRF